MIWTYLFILVNRSRTLTIGKRNCGFCRLFSFNWTHCDLLESNELKMLSENDFFRLIRAFIIFISWKRVSNDLLKSFSFFARQTLNGNGPIKWKFAKSSRWKFKTKRTYVKLFLKVSTHYKLYWKLFEKISKQSY